MLYSGEARGRSSVVLIPVVLAYSAITNYHIYVVYMEIFVDVKLFIE